MIIDCFPFNNEMDLLEIRLAELNPVVDRFILVEANRTQKYEEKPFYFELNKGDFSQYLHKIIHIKLEDCPPKTDGMWGMENFQRNGILRGLQGLALEDNDWIVVSDLDEMYSESAAWAIKRSPSYIEACSVWSTYHAYYLNIEVPAYAGITVGGIRKKHLAKYSPQRIRDERDKSSFFINISRTYPAWHFTYMGGAKRLSLKSLNTCEGSNYDEVYYEKFLRELPSRMLMWPENRTNNPPLRHFSVDKLPKHVSIQKDKFSHLLR